MNRHQIFGWIAASLLTAYFCAPAATAAEELTPKEKTRIIWKIVKTKIDENWNQDVPWKGLNGREDAVLSEILDEVKRIMPLKANKRIGLPPDVAEKLDAQVRRKYPASDEELRVKYTAEAEKKIPVYRTGDKVTIRYRIYGGTFDKFTGKFYRQDPKFVWVGNKKIAKADLKEDYAVRFDSVQADKLRRRFIEESIERYHKERADFEKNLKDEPLHERQGYIRYEDRWLSAGGMARKAFWDTVEAKMEKSKCPECGNLKYIVETYGKCKFCGDTGVVFVGVGSSGDVTTHCSHIGGRQKRQIPCPTCCSNNEETTESYPDSDRRQKSPVHKSQVWIHHPDAVSECIVYVFRCTDNLEEGLKNIAEVHWEINDLTDKYFEARDQGQLDMARDLKNTCSQSREKAHSAFQKFLTDELVVGTVKYTRPGVHLKEVKGEYIFFIIEVVERGKYVRAWCHRAKNGDDLHIEGRNIRRGR